MAGYQAPLGDMEFVCRDLADLAPVLRLIGGGDTTPELISSVLEEERTYLDELDSRSGRLAQRVGLEE